MIQGRTSQINKTKNQVFYLIDYSVFSSNLFIVNNKDPQAMKKWNLKFIALVDLATHSNSNQISKLISKCKVLFGIGIRIVVCFQSNILCLDYIAYLI